MGPLARLARRGLTARAGGDLPRDAFARAALRFAADGDEGAGLEVAAMLAKARVKEVRGGQPTLAGDAVVDVGVEKGLWLQAKVGEALLKRDKAFAHAGFKVGATNAAGQARLGLTEPFHGELYRQTVLLAQSPDQAVAHAALSTRGIEAEWAFILAEDVPVRGDTEALFERDDVERFVLAVAPSIEVTATRFSTAVAPGLFLADGAGNGSVLLGAKSLWRDVRDPEVQKAGEMAVITSFGDEVKCSGDGTQVLGHPLEGLRWLCNRTDRATLRKGDVILSGAANGVAPLPAATSLPATMTVNFDGWGCLDLTIDAESWEGAGGPNFASGARPLTPEDL